MTSKDDHLFNIQYSVTVWAYCARYLLNEHSIQDGSDAPQYLAGHVLK